MHKNVHTENKFGNLVDISSESIVGPEFARKIVGAVAAGLQIRGSGLVGDRFRVDQLEAGPDEMRAQSFGDHRAPNILGFLLSRRARHEVAVLEFEFEDRDLVGRTCSAGSNPNSRTCREQGDYWGCYRRKLN